MAMVSRSLMESCSPEGRWRPAAATATAAAFGGSSPEMTRQPGGGPWPTPFKLRDGASMEVGFHLTVAALEEENLLFFVI